MNGTGCCDTRCSTPEVIEVPGPEGDAGTPGTDGTDGVNAYTIVATSTFVVPAVNANVNITVANSTWMVIGQNLFVEGAGYFEVVTLPSDTSVQAKYLDYEVNTHATEVIPVGAGVSPGGTQPAAPTVATVAPITAYASGTAYTITASDAAVVFGTTQPSVTLTTAGVWRLSARLKIGYVGATFAAVRTVTLKMRRTNNTASDIASSSSTWATEIITTLTYTGDILTLPDIAYTTANVNDVITLFAIIDVIPTAGSIQIQEASIFAEYLNA
jgi:hypothetical protein